MKRLFLITLLALALTGCSKHVEDIPIEENAVVKAERDDFIACYTDDVNYKQGVYEFGDNLISYAFPVDWDMQIINGIIYLSEDSSDISYEIKAVSSEEYREMINDGSLLEKTFGQFSMFPNNKDVTLNSELNIDVLGTASSSTYLNQVQLVHSAYEYNDVDYNIPYFVCSKVYNDKVLLINVSTILRDGNYDTEGYLKYLDDTYKDMCNKLSTLFRYIYFGFITAEEQDEALLNSYGVFPYYREVTTPIEELIDIRDNSKINTVVYRYSDDIQISAFGLEGFATAHLSDSGISWNPVDGISNNTSYSLDVEEYLYTGTYLEDTLLAWARNYIIDISSPIYVNDDLTNDGVFTVISEEIETYSNSDSLALATQYYVICNAGGVEFKLPVIFYNIEYGGFNIVLKCSYTISDERLTSLETLDSFNESYEFNDVEMLKIEEYNNKYEIIDSYSRGLLRLLYDGNIMLKEIKYEEETY